MSYAPVDVVVYLLGAFGLAYIVGHSVASVAFRRWLYARGRAGVLLTELLECPACFGFWTGVVASVVLLPAHSVLEASTTPLIALAAGCVTAGSNFLLATLSGLTNTIDGK